jgi:hypothetical protein
MIRLGRVPRPTNLTLHPLGAFITDLRVSLFQPLSVSVIVPLEFRVIGMVRIVGEILSE